MRTMAQYVVLAKNSTAGSRRPPSLEVYHLVWNSSHRFYCGWCGRIQDIFWHQKLKIYLHLRYDSYFGCCYLDDTKMRNILITHCAGWFYVSLTQTSHFERGKPSWENVPMRLACGAFSWLMAQLSVGGAVYTWAGGPGFWESHGST